MLFLVDNRRQLVEKIIPFFEKYELLVKPRDFQKFKEVITGLENKMHHKKETFIELIKKCYEMNFEGKQRRYKLEEVLEDIQKRKSPETTCQTQADR